MHRFHGKLASLVAFAALAAIAGGSVSGAEEAKEEKPQKESKEVRTAKQMNIQILQQMGVHQNLELEDYVQRVGEKLAAVSERPELPWKFTIIDTDDVNAFATMGGYVYISRGILPYFQNEAELAAVLGHEIGHIAAEHLKKQQQKGMLSGLASAATAIFTGQPALADLTNMAGLAIIKGYGREAELEADRLGARYLAKAGYDPEAMIHVISTLKDQDTFERERARLENRDPHIYHGVFSSHPDNDKRLHEVVEAAGKVATADQHPDNRDVYLNRISGLPVGPSRAQGVTRGSRFYHADMGFTVAFPTGWMVQNQPTKVVAATPQKDAALQLYTMAPPQGMSPEQFLTRNLQGTRLEKAEPFEANGLKGYTAIAQNVALPWGNRGPARYAVVYFNNLAFVFMGATRTGSALSASDPLMLSSIKTFRRLRDREFETAEPDRIRVVKATSQTTIAALAKTSPIKKYPAEQLRLLNDLYPDKEPTAGQSIKIVQ